MDFDDDDLFNVFDAEPAVETKAKRGVRSDVQTGSGDKVEESKVSSKRKRSVIEEPKASENGISRDVAAQFDIVKLSKKAKESPAVQEDSTKSSNVKIVSASERKSNMEAFRNSGINGGAMAASSQIIRMEQKGNCSHDIAIPEGYNYVPLHKDAPPENPAKTYPFTLDTFQAESVKCLERCESVLVSAHTSAGKTVVAEYAVALALKKKQRIIYTSPIKALSNQKYREMEEEFGDVGLMTGDVTKNPEASCLVMTTEILRSMLYRGSEILREVAWVVFDEIHYMRDKERGVVWEETLILLPDTVRYVFLSATIPNARQFADWICRLHNQPCNVIYTDFRPTPLQHYIYPSGGEGLHLVVDEKGDFREMNFQKAMAVLAQSTDAPKASGGKGGNKTNRGKGNSDIYRIVRMIIERNYQPVIVFSFSKKECEAYALQLSKLDFNENEEKEQIQEVFTQAISTLSDEDKQLPQINHILPLLKRGIGIHHSGLLPILKEVIEILFQEGLLKALFATETFSIGLNMPARTVVFTNVRKFDGRDFRWVSGGEYIQMSGRAGRRGLDDRGIVILMVDEKMEPNIATALLKGQSDALNSAFHLSYNMILNLMRVEEISPEYMLERCFNQFQNNAVIPELQSKLLSLNAETQSIEIPNADMVEAYYNIKLQLEKLKIDMKMIISQPQFCLPFLQPGRLVKLSDSENDWGWGCVVNFQKKISSTKVSSDMRTVTDGGKPVFIVEVLIKCKKSSTGSKKPVPCPANEKGELQVIPFLISLIDELSSLRIYIPKDLRAAENRYTVEKSLQEVEKRFPDGIPRLDPIEDMKISSDALTKCIRKVQSLEKRLYANPIHDDPQKEAINAKYEEKMVVMKEMESVKSSIKEARNILQMDELKSRRRVLRRLGYTSEGDVIEMKGRVACEINTGDELLLTEMIFTGVFNELTVEQTVALLSCFVFQEKSDEVPKMAESLKGPLQQMQESARRIAKVSIESKMQLDEEEYVNSFKPQMMDLVHAWCKGAKFSDICKMTDIFEGSIIRCMRRLEELLRQMCQAAKSIGNTELENKFAEGTTKLKRDIVFAASLYL
eukprot:Nk52_evm5s271 gene=Nk52_evmTU5s271